MAESKWLGIAVVAGLALSLPGPATCQSVRVLLIRPELEHVVPADALQVFKQAILDSGSDVAFVRSIAEASDLIELTDYRWKLDDQAGVLQTWRVCFRPLDDPEGPPAGRTRPSNFILVVPGKTLEESMRASGEMLHDRFRQLLGRFQPVVPR